MATPTITPPPGLTGAPVPPPAPRRRARRPLPYALLLPSVLALVLVLGFPLGRQLVMSFQEFGLAQQFGQPPTWVGLENYATITADSEVWLVVLRSVVFCLTNAALTMVLGIGIALLMTRLPTALRLAVQVSLLLTWAMPVIAALTVWLWLIDSQYGVVNHVLTRLGLDYAGHSWLLEPLSFYAVLTVIVVWASVPFVAFTTYAALTQVPDETVEAATLDGAGGWQRFRYIVLPTITPVLAVVALLQVVWDLRVFPQTYVLQGAGGVSSETNLLGTYVYRLGIAEGEFGLSAAVAMFLLVITVALTFRRVRAMVREEA